LARLWASEVSRLATSSGELAGSREDSPGVANESSISRTDVLRFCETELLPAEAKGETSLAYLDACLAVDAPLDDDTLTLTAFVRALRDSARATAAASLGEGLGDDDGGWIPETSARTFKKKKKEEFLKDDSPGKTEPAPTRSFRTPPENTRVDEDDTEKAKRFVRTGKGGGPLAGATARSHALAIARVAELADAAVGTLKRRFQKQGSKFGGLDPVALTRALADVSVTPGDARAALAELRAWEGFPLDVRLQRFRQAMRPRSVRLAERKARRAEAEDENRRDREAKNGAGSIPVPDAEEETRYGLGFAIAPHSFPYATTAVPIRFETSSERRSRPLAAAAAAAGARATRLAQAAGVCPASKDHPGPPSKTEVAGDPASASAEEEEEEKEEGVSNRWWSSVVSDAERAAALAPAGTARSESRGTATRAGSRPSAEHRPFVDTQVGVGGGPGSARRAEDSAAAAAAEGFRRVKETLTLLEANAERFENDLMRSSATLAAMDAARREREDAALVALARRARETRRRVETEEKAEREARGFLKREHK
jgi:hypothetical protein